MKVVEKLAAKLEGTEKMKMYLKQKNCPYLHDTGSH